MIFFSSLHEWTHIALKTCIWFSFNIRANPKARTKEPFLSFHLLYRFLVRNREDLIHRLRNVRAEKALWNPLVYLSQFIDEEIVFLFLMKILHCVLFLFGRSSLLKNRRCFMKRPVQLPVLCTWEVVSVENLLDHLSIEISFFALVFPWPFLSIHYPIFSLYVVLSLATNFRVIDIE